MIKQTLLSTMLLGIAILMAAPSEGRAQSVHVGYSVPLDGGTGGLEAGGGFRFEFLQLSFGTVGLDARVLWSRTTLGSELPGQQSRWLSGDFLRAELLGSIRFLDDWFRPFVILGPAVMPLALRTHVRSKAAGEIAAFAGGPGAQGYITDGFDLGIGAGGSAGGGAELWLGPVGVSMEVRFTMLFGSATVGADPAAGSGGEPYRATGSYTMHQAIFRMGLLYGGWGHRG